MVSLLRIDFGRAYRLQMLEALLQFAFQLGGAVSLCISQTLFIGKLTSGMESELPAMSTAAVINAGAYNLPGLTSSREELYALRIAYRTAIRDVFVFLLVAGGLAFLASFGFEHKNVRRVEQEGKESDDTVM